MSLMVVRTTLPRRAPCSTRRFIRRSTVQRAMQNLRASSVSRLCLHRRPVCWLVRRARCQQSASRHVGHARSAAADCVDGRHGANSLTGRSAALRRSTRPRRSVDAGRRSRSGLQTAVELRLHEKRAGQLEDLIGLAQLLVLAFEFLQPLQLRFGDAFPLTRVNLMTFDPFVKGLGTQPILGAMDSMASHSDGCSLCAPDHANSSCAYLG